MPVDTVDFNELCELIEKRHQRYRKTLGLLREALNRIEPHDRRSQVERETYIHLIELCFNGVEEGERSYRDLVDRVKNGYGGLSEDTLKRLDGLRGKLGAHSDEELIVELLNIAESPQMPA